MEIVLKEFNSKPKLTTFNLHKLKNDEIVPITTEATRIVATSMTGVLLFELPSSQSSRKK